MSPESGIFIVADFRERQWCEIRQHLLTAASIATMAFLVCCAILFLLIIAL